MPETQSFNPEVDKKCPYCAEVIKKEALICKHCGLNLQTGQPSIPPAPIVVAPKVAKPGSTVGDGVKLGCGMFIVLPLIILFIIIFLVVLAGSH